MLITLARFRLVTTGILFGLTSTAFAEPVDFNRTIRPILSANCFQCHGPDANERKADLRLDLRNEAVKERDGVTAIVPGHPERSAVISRMRSSDPDEKMPPAEAHKTVNPVQIEALSQWIAEGAPYADHWAFVKPSRPKISGIDNLVREKLRPHQLGLSSEADRSTLLRRLTFDLTGLPPALDEVDAFVKDTGGDAYEKAVDRLLESIHYGERMALAWMDAARYGDSSVMHADGHRDMWPWRDWVIRAYNSNMPFDRFTIEQLAGDLLPDSTSDQRVASGFNRNHATSDEGGAIPEELRVSYVVDRVKTTANVWLALSMECAQCHDHKYDPVSQEEYYRFYAYFNNTTDPGMQTRNGNQAPVEKVFTDEQRKSHAAAKAEAEALKKERASVSPSAAEVETWVKALRSGDPAADVKYHPWKQLGPIAATDEKQAFKKDFGPEKGENPLKKKVKGHEWKDGETAWNENGKVHLLSIPDLHVQYFARIIQSPSLQVVPLSLGSDDGIKLWLNGKLLVQNDVHRIAGPDQDKAVLNLRKGENHLLMKIVNLNGGSGFYFAPGAAGLPDEILALIEQDTAQLEDEDRKKLRDYYATKVWPVGLALNQKIVATEARAKNIMDGVPTTMVMQDNARDMRKTYVLNRGQYDQPIKEKEISPGVPESMPALQDDDPPNRLGLARWLTRPDHPLMARVIVNRIWALFFGEGLVRTVGDFGNQGEMPSHPELLDDLALDFIESGWDVKALVKQIVMSETYRQSSRLTPKLKERDPENRLLARGPRFRLQGEFIRDNALAVSGLLVPEVGGPSVKPYQPEGIWNEVSLNGGLRYKPDEGKKLYRRSLYTYWKRSAPMPNMLIFDAPTREQCVVQRARTNTPLQAFVTLNDPQFVEAGRVFAARVMREGGEKFESRLERGFRLATARVPTDKETDILRASFEEQRHYFSNHKEDAESYLKTGKAPQAEDLDPAEHAAWTVIAQMILNLDEVLTRG